MSVTSLTWCVTVFHELVAYRVAVNRRTILSGPNVAEKRGHSMELNKLATLTFNKNVGTADRIFRLTSGTALTLAGWYFGVPLWGAVTLTVLGLMWTTTGVLSKCSIYYVLGYSTRPVCCAVSPSQGE